MPTARCKASTGTVIDLTARKEMEDKLRRANTELEQFAYAAAHDLQEPLRNVALAAALLQVERTDLQQGPEPPLLTAVVENARRMEAMVKDLLAYSRALDVSENEDARADGNIVLDKVLQNLSLAVDREAGRGDPRRYARYRSPGDSPAADSAKPNRKRFEV